MTGTIVEVHRAQRGFPAGGEIRSPELPERIRFDEWDLAGMKITEALGREVTFTVAEGNKATRVRPLPAEQPKTP